jgi:hypothetical protein
MIMINKWQEKFWEIVKQPEIADSLKQAAIDERLAVWTEILTGIVVKTCESMGWQASAKGHKLELLPVPRSEYLAIDVMAFAEGDKQWRFPAAAIELENSQSYEHVAYSLWKVLCLRSELRMVFCYCRNPGDRAKVISYMKESVIAAMRLPERVQLSGETVVVVGSRDNSDTFPYGFFKWWWLEKNTGNFRKI